MFLFNGSDVNIHHDPWSCLCFSNPTIMQVRLINFNLCGVSSPAGPECNQLLHCAPPDEEAFAWDCPACPHLRLPTVFLVWKRKGEQDANHNTKQHETEATRQQENVDSKLSTWKLVMKEAAGFTEIWRVTNRNDFCMWRIFFGPRDPTCSQKFHHNVGIVPFTRCM